MDFELCMLAATAAVAQQAADTAVHSPACLPCQHPPHAVPRLAQDTINILRGLSEKYSSYHGVRVSDRALVMSAVLADRYITTRFLPDKAIDVVDEACANLRVQLESMPEQLDAMLRKQYQLQVEEAALAKEKDAVGGRGGSLEGML